MSLIDPQVSRDDRAKLTLAAHAINENADAAIQTLLKVIKTDPVACLKQLHRHYMRLQCNEHQVRFDNESRKFLCMC